MYHTGDAADGMYFIEDGTVSIRIEQDAGEVEISVLSKGGYFGELALVTHRPRAASAYAATDVKAACKLLFLFFFLLSINVRDFMVKLFEWSVACFIFICFQELFRN